MQARRDHSGLLGKRREFPADTRGSAFSYCLAQDPVCQSYTQIIHGFGAHTGGYQKTEAARAARAVAKLIRPKAAPGEPNAWPTGRNDGKPALFIWLGANFMSPSWSSCDNTYCLVGVGKRVYLFQIDDGIDELGWMSVDVNPRETLLDAGMTADHVDALLAPK